MNTITLQRKEYETLASQAKAYRAIASTFAGVQAERTVEEIVSNFESTRVYSDAFLGDLKKGLIDLRKSKAWRSKS